MAKKTVTDIAREQGVSEAEVKQKLDEAGAAKRMAVRHRFDD